MTTILSCLSHSYGNQTKKSNEVEVIIDKTKIIKDFLIVPTFNGLNTKEKIDRFLAGELSLEEIKWIKLKASVSQNTQALELSFADYTNLNELPNTDYNSGYSKIFGGLNSKTIKIATINSQVEDNLILNPHNNENVKRNHLPLNAKELGLNNICTQSECLWEVNLPIPWSLSGGQYEIEAKGFKGEDSESKTTGFVLDGRIAAAPIILRLEKYQENSKNYFKLQEYNKKHYTNQRKIKLTGVADPEAILKIIMISGGESLLIGKTEVSSTGIWEFEYELPDQDKEYEFSLESHSINDFNIVESEISETVILDRKNEGIKSVKTSVPDKGINPWASTGDRVGFEIEAKESMHYCDLVKEDLYLQKFKNIDSLSLDFSSSFNINRKQEGLYYPIIRCVDWAGNKKAITNNEIQIKKDVLGKLNIKRNEINIINVSKDNLYLYQNKNRDSGLDFRLYIDNTLTEKTNFIKTNWSDGLDGVKADGKFPEKDRLIDQYVIKNDKIILSGWAEKYQKVSLSWLKAGRFQEKLADVWVDNSRCIKTNDDNDIKKNNLITKHSEKCYWEYEFKFADTGLSPFGIPSNWYLFQAQVVDLAGNESEWNDSVTIYHDTEEPKNHKIINISSESYNPIIDFSDKSITKDNKIEIKHSGERLADVEYKLQFTNEKIATGYKNLKIGQIDNGYAKLIKNGDNDFNYWGKTTFNLGETKRDDNDLKNCTIINNNRRVGICSDGNYIIKMKMIDTAGNNGNWIEEKVERDTVRPDKPEVKIWKNGDIFKETLAIKIEGEKEAKAHIKVTNSKGREWNLTKYLNDNGVYQTNDLLGKLECEKVSYTVVVTLIDRALNVGSSSKPSSIETKECPYCGRTSGQLKDPLRDDQSYIRFKYGRSRDYFGGNKFHHGVDYNGIYTGQPVYPVKAGKIIYAGWDKTGYGYLVKIKHSGNLYTLYAHLSEQPKIKVGQYVGVDNQIGKVGSTGNSSAPHLHFEVRDGCDLQKCSKDPQGDNYLGKEKTNLDQEQFQWYCVENGGGGDEDEKCLYEGKSGYDLDPININLDSNDIKIPAPKIATVTKEDADRYGVYAYGISSGYSVQVDYSYEECGFMSFLFGCDKKDSREIIANAVKESKWRAYKNENYIKEGNNENYNGRFKVSFKTPNDLNQNDKVKLASGVAGSFVLEKDGKEKVYDFWGKGDFSKEKDLEKSYDNKCIKRRPKEKEIDGVKAYVLDVPYFNQYKEPNGSNYPPDGWQMCGAASSTMVAGYFGKLSYNERDDHDLKRYMYSDQGLNLGNPCNNSLKSGTFAVTQYGCNRSYAVGIKKYLINRGISFENQLSWRFNFKEIKSTIDDGNPIILSMIAPIGHIIVVKGYTEDGRLVVNDPARNVLTDKRGTYNEKGFNAIYKISYPIKLNYYIKIIE